MNRLLSIALCAASVANAQEIISLEPDDCNIDLYAETQTPLPTELEPQLIKMLQERHASEPMFSELMAGGPGLTEDTAWNFKQWGQITEYLFTLFVSDLPYPVQMRSHTPIVKNGKLLIKQVYAIEIKDTWYTFSLWFDCTDTISKILKDTKKLVEESEELLATMRSVQDKESAEAAADYLIEHTLPIFKTWERVPAFPDEFFDERGDLKNYYQGAIYAELYRLSGKRYYGSEKLDKVF